MSSKIAIAGCGITGLAAAVFLARRGHRVSLFERFEKPQSVGAGILLQPSGLRVLADLDLLESVTATASRIDSLVGFTPAGKTVMNLHYRDLSPKLYGLGVHRANLFDVLYEAAQQAGAEIFTGIDVGAIRTAGNTAIPLTADGTELGEFAAVIIADGRRSKLRDFIGATRTDKPYPWAALWAVADAPDGFSRRQLAQCYRRASVMIGLLPTGCHPQTGNPCVSLFWSLPADDYERWKTTAMADWRTEAGRHWPQLAPLLERFSSHEQLAFAGYGDVVLSRYHRDNLVCIGDAAHSMSPQLGQGANLGLIDAAVLADCLDTLAPAAAFAEYTRRRLAHIRYYQFASRWLTPFFQSHSRTAALLRDTMFPLINYLPPAYKQGLRTVAGFKTGLFFDRSVHHSGRVRHSERVRHGGR